MKFGVGLQYVWTFARVGSPIHGLHCNGPSQGDGEVCEKCKNAIVLGGFIGLDEKKTMMVVD